MRQTQVHAKVLPRRPLEVTEAGGYPISTISCLAQDLGNAQ